MKTPIMTLLVSTCQSDVALRDLHRVRSEHALNIVRVAHPREVHGIDLKCFRLVLVDKTGMADSTVKDIRAFIDRLPVVEVQRPRDYRGAKIHEPNIELEQIVERIRYPRVQNQPAPPPPINAVQMVAQAAVEVIDAIRAEVVEPTPPAVEIVRVDFHGDTLEAVKRDDGIWVGVKRACENVGLDGDTQAKRLRSQAWATTALMTVVAADGKSREMFMLRLDRVAMWLATIEASRVDPAIRPKLERYQRECADVLAAYFTPGAIPEDDFDRILGAMQDTRKRLREQGNRIEQIAASIAPVQQTADAAVDLAGQAVSRVNDVAAELLNVKRMQAATSEAKVQESLGLEMGPECEEILTTIRADFGLWVNARIALKTGWKKPASNLNAHLRGKCGVMGNGRIWRHCERSKYELAISYLPDLMVLVASQHGLNMNLAEAVSIVRNRTDPPIPLQDHKPQLRAVQ